jgi:hypothetical protein
LAEFELLKKKALKLEQLVKRNGLEAASAKSMVEKGLVDGLKKKGPVGGGAGGSSRRAKGMISRDTGGGSDSDKESSDEDEKSLDNREEDPSSDQEPDDLDIVINEFRYTNHQQKSGYFLGHYSDKLTGGLERFEMKETLVDFPETTLKYMYDNYGHHEHTVKYIEKVCQSMWTFPKSNVKRPVVLGFKTLNAYVKFNGWPRMENKWKSLLSEDGTHKPNPGLLFPQHDKPKKAAAVSKGRKGRAEKEPFVAPMKEMLVMKDGVLQLVQLSMAEATAQSRLGRGLDSSIPPTVVGKPTKAKGKSNTTASTRAIILPEKKLETLVLPLLILSTSSAVGAYAASLLFPLDNDVASSSGFRPRPTFRLSFKSIPLSL